MIINYIKIAWKVLLRHPFYTFITLFGISLTLTVLMVLTSFLDHLIGAHYPETNRDRSLYIKRIALRDSTNQYGSMSDPSFKFLKQHATTLRTPEKVAIVSSGGNANTYINNKRIRLTTKFSDANLWDVAEFNFTEGKPYTAQNVANGDMVAVISEAFKTSYFGDEGPVVGKIIDVDNARYRVIGVVKSVPVTRLYSAADAYFPYTVPKSNYRVGDYIGGYDAIILARNQADFPAIEAEYSQSVRQIQLPFVNNGLKVYHIQTEAKPYLESFIQQIPTNPDSTIFYAVISAIMLMFMTLPAINLINLNVGRSMERASEIGIRKAFGAPTQTLLNQFVIENIFITAIGGLLALGLSWIIILLINQSGWIAHLDLTINLPVFGISVLVCLIFGVVSGVVPAWRMARLPVTEALKNS